MDALQPSILQFLNVVHRAPRALGIEELARTEKVPDARTHCTGGSVHSRMICSTTQASAFARSAWNICICSLMTRRLDGKSLRYAIAGEWVIRQPGKATLYLRCVVPTARVEQLPALLDAVREETCTGITSITTRDGWQVMRDITSDASEPEAVPATVLRHTNHSVWEVVERVPLLVPVIFETVEQRRNLPEVWRHIYARLGERTWDYVPRGANRLRTNGKTYVKDVYALLNHTGLFRQNIVRYQPLTNIGTAMVLHLHGEITSITSAFARHATVLDLYPINEGEALLRIVTTHAATQRILSSTSNLPRITDWYFIDATRNRVRTRFAYELLFDPTITEWIFPAEEIRRRLRGGS